MRLLSNPRLGPASLCLGLLLLAAHPLVWLVQTWLDPAYDSYGLWVALLSLGLLIWSASSPLQRADARRRRLGLGLLALTATVRLFGQSLGINTLGALALAVDVYAIGLLLHVDRRARPLAPGWLALLFIFALPLERVLQRGLGFALQQLSASSACTLLNLGGAPVHCAGIQMQWHEQVVLVDLPCSGTRGLLLLLLFQVTLATLIRPSLRQALGGMLLTLAMATLGNSLRIVLLAIGLVHRAALGDVDVLAEPWHSAIGLLTLALSAGPLLLWARHLSAARQPPPSLLPPTTTATDGIQPRLVSPRAGLAFLLLCATIISLPPQPLDVVHAQPTPLLPGHLGAFAAQPGLLTAQEQSYFTRYGGGAARAAYGPYGLLVVSTRAPLRHLHAPEECLAGAGHQVRYLGQSGGPRPSALYRSRDVQGHEWRIAVSYVSTRGEWTAHVAEAVWRWLQAPGTGWQMVQRSAPWDAPAPAVDQFDQTVWRALELPGPAPAFAIATSTPSL